MMNQPQDAARQIRHARVAGFVYLLLIVLFMSGQLMITRAAGMGDFTQRLTHIVEDQTLYRIGLVLQLLASVFTVVLAYALYEVLRPVHEGMARLALYFRLGEAFGGLTTFLSFAALSLQANPDYLQLMGATQLKAMVALANSANFASFNITTLLFGFGSTLFFYLFTRTRYLPLALSAFGLFASVVALLTSIANLILPAWAHVIGFGWIPVFVAEVVIGLWLLIRGVKVEPWFEAAAVA